MNILIITTGEAPIIPITERVQRSGSLAKYLSSNHNVNLWTSNFFHQKKVHINNINLKLNNKFNYKTFRTLGYKKNISIKRIIDHFIFGLNIFFNLIILKKKPDLILVSMPSCDLAFFTSIYCKLMKIKLVVDVRDMWPDIFWLRCNNKYLSLIIKGFSIPYIFFRNYSLKNANGVTSISNEFLKWSISNIKSNNKMVSQYFYLTSSNNNFIQRNINKKKIHICFFGVISYKKFDFDCLLNYLNKFNTDKFIFHICGNGDDIEKLHSDFKSFKNVNIYGHLNTKEITAIAKISHYGLANYNPTFDFNLSIPSKIIEYLSYDLDIIYSLEGETNNFLKMNSIGFFYKYNDPLSFEYALSKLGTNFQSNKCYNIFEKYFKSDKVNKSFELFLMKVLNE
jgi:hypothetical protein